VYERPGPDSPPALHLASTSDSGNASAHSLPDPQILLIGKALVEEYSFPRPPPLNLVLIQAARCVTISECCKLQTNASKLVTVQACMSLESVPFCTPLDLVTKNQICTLHTPKASWLCS